MDKMNEVQKAAYLEAYMAQQAAAFQQQGKFSRYENMGVPTIDDKKKLNLHSTNGFHGPKFNGINNGSNYGTSIKIPQVSSVGEPFKPPLESTFTVPDEGLGFDDGVRVLRTLGSWTPDYGGLSSRTTPGMLFPELPYANPEMNMNQRKVPTTVLPVTHSTPGTLTRPTPTIPQPKKEDLQQRQIHQNTVQNQQQMLPTNSGQKTNTVQNNSGTQSSGKSFTCTVCGKSLARKDKLVIHTRIHTGEKPYVCEVCDKAFARRDKLVIHMNKMKHRTPTNIAPLGKRTNPEKIMKKPSEESEADIPKAAVINLQTAAANWSCELCGQMMTTREEWMVHAKAHLEEKITGMGVISTNNYTNNQRTVANYPTNSVHIPPITPLNNSYPIPMAGNLPQHGGHYQPFNMADRQYCPVCRQGFGNKAEFMLHVRIHFDNVVKPQETENSRSQSQGSVSGPLIDNNSICS